MPKMLKAERLGENACGMTITGDARNQEPEHVRIHFPGGEVEVTRAADGPDADYWIHVHVHHPKSDAVAALGEAAAKITDARLDILGRHSSEVDVGEFENPDLYHLAVRVARRK
jgi:hypothetical protein